MRLLVKVGGAPIETADGRAQLAHAVTRAQATGHEVILVHGGGNQIRTLCKRLGLAERYVDGLRVTDAETADVVLMTLAGLVNRQVVDALQRGGVRAAGLCGADGHTFTARRHRHGGEDLGYVGQIHRIDRALVETLLTAGYVPVLATAAPLAPSEDAAFDHFYNINADQAAGPLAAALHADALLFLSDVPGVLDGDKRRVEQLTPERAAALREGGVIAGGMIPKVDAALAALTVAPPGTLVKIANAAGDDAILAALSPTHGTTFVRA